MALVAYYEKGLQECLLEEAKSLLYCPTLPSVCLDLGYFSGRCLGRRFGMCFGSRVLWIEAKECWVDGDIELVITKSLWCGVLEVREYSGPYAISI